MKDDDLIQRKDAWDDKTPEQQMEWLREEVLAERASRRGERTRTIIMCVAITGLISLFIGRAVEVTNSNKQQNRSRTNCVLAQRATLLTAQQFDDQADSVLGDESDKDGDPNEKIKPLKIKGTSFEEFEPLIIAQARENRVRAREYQSLLRDCNEIFPPVKFLFFGGSIKDA